MSAVSTTSPLVLPLSLSLPTMTVSHLPPQTFAYTLTLSRGPHLLRRAEVSRQNSRIPLTHPHSPAHACLRTSPPTLPPASAEETFPWQAGSPPPLFWVLSSGLRNLLPTIPKVLPSSTTTRAFLKPISTFCHHLVPFLLTSQISGKNWLCSLSLHFCTSHFFLCPSSVWLPPPSFC